MIDGQDFPKDFETSCPFCIFRSVRLVTNADRIQELFMKITLQLRGSLTKYFEGEKTRQIEVPDGCTAEEALKTAGIDWTVISNFGFVAVNGKRVMIYDKLQEGDELKAYPKISGG
jgi:hypothetical protein